MFCISLSFTCLGETESLHGVLGTCDKAALSLTVVISSSFSWNVIRHVPPSLAVTPIYHLFLSTKSAYTATARSEARKFFVGGNWKCNGSVSQVNDLVSMLNQFTLTTDTEVVVCPSQVYVQGVQEKLRGDVSVGAQDCWVGGNGAHTGETSADMLADMKVGWVIVGHSERRGNGESDEEVARKAKYALDKGLKVMVCCGEPQEAREAGTTNDFVFPQIKAYADVFSKEDWANVVVAYEPIWAIGTGLTATPEQAQDTHADIRQYLGEVAGSDVASETRILYGGSASGATAPGLSVKPDIDGFLVGGASLKPEFADIVNCNGDEKSLKPVNIGINGFGRIGR